MGCDPKKSECNYFLTFFSMINAHEASRLLREMTPEERLQALKEKVSQSTRDALDKAVRDAISGFNTRIYLIL